MSTLLLLLDEEEELGWRNVLPPIGTTFRYPDLLLEWAPTSLPTDAVQNWEDITERLREWSWSYGRNDEIGRFEAGSGYVLLDNRDRELDPSYADGAWFGNVKPRRMFRLRYRWNGVVYPGFVAYSRGFPQTYPAMGYDSVVRVDLVDAFAILQSLDLVVGFSRGEETTGARIDAVLDAVGVPAALRDIDDGTVDVEAIDVTSSGTSGLDHARTVAADSEFGQVFVAKDGKVTFHDRHRRLNATSQHTFTDDPAASLRYGGDLTIEYDETYLWNYIRVTASSDPDTAPGIAEDAGSIDEYHTIVRSVSSELTTLIDRESLANYLLSLYSEPVERAAALPLNAAREPDAMWPVVLGLEISDRVTIERYADTAAVKTLVQNVEGIRHSCRPGGPWLTAVATSPADTTGYWVLGDVSLSQLGSTTVLAP